MAKITLSPLTGSYGSVTAINSRLQEIEDTFNNNVLWRDGFTSEPNSMQVDLDLNNFNLINANFDYTTSTIEALAFTQGGVAVVDLSDQSSLGGKALEPATRNDGVSPIQAGDTYYNNGNNFLYTYNGVGFDIATATAASTAAATSINDVGGFYKEIDVEGALQENGMATNFLVHEAPIPGMYVIINKGTIQSGVTLNTVSEQSTATISTPSVNPRIDRIVLDRVTGLFSVMTGAESGSPTPPDLVGQIAIAQILLQTTSTEITDDMITDERATFVQVTNFPLETVSLVSHGSSTVSFSIPIEAKKVTILLSEVKHDNAIARVPYLFLGTGGFPDAASDYFTLRQELSASYTSTAGNTSGVQLTENLLTTSHKASGRVVIENITGNLWQIEATVAEVTLQNSWHTISTKILTGSLDLVTLELFTANFISGWVRVYWE